jgi:hypothetical protein
MEHSFPLSIGQSGFTLPSDIYFFWKVSIEWPSVFCDEVKLTCGGLCMGFTRNKLVVLDAKGKVIGMYLDAPGNSESWVS